ncbi:hypothetical protein KUTeg_014887 [Tegillarca granosa]|uniref:Glycerol-3-phosphate dehydrogenase [NAD(+)] n=1 Tax=Tegillarca granosa TaxID=220873 RepID=A0ABQ9ENJ3_TEGGR|nr:hypothetical protein KUTeg_014887 [Tegillarca granosa]
MGIIRGMSLTDSGMKLISEVIQDELNIPCLVMMGANLAQEVAEEQLCETTIGCENEENGQLMKELFASPYFRCTAVNDKKTVELCGALKNVVGIGAGIVDGLNFGDNTKAAVIRLGLMEMIKFAEEFFPGGNTATFFESCGIADLVATCHGGRNRLLGESVVKSNKDGKYKTVKELEKEILRGQSFQGPRIGREVYKMLESKDMVDRFPLFTAVHKICERQMDPKEFIQCLRNHPEHM